MSDQDVARAIAAHRQTLRALESRLDAPAASSEKDRLKDEIITLFKLIEQEIADLAALKDDVKKLVDKWKALQAAQTLAPQFTEERPIVHADHIGASTFIEKGWSRLSLGDYRRRGNRAEKGACSFRPTIRSRKSLLGWALMLQEKYDDALL